MIVVSKSLARRGVGKTCQCVLSIPCVERLEELETVGGGGDSNVDGGALGGGSLVSVHTRVVSTGGKTSAGGLLEHELVAILVLEGVGEGVEVQGAGKRHGDNEIRGGNEGVGGGVGVVTSSEVTVVRRDDGVGLALLDIAYTPS